MITIENISKTFDGLEVLKNITLKIEEGDIIYIKRSNGCGKSTLLKIIAGLLAPDSGKIDIGNNHLGALIENPSFIENETATFNLKFLYNFNGSFKIEYVKKYFDFLNLDINLKIPMKKYSIGMRQKVGIIQAVMENQTLILFDEPSRGLDEDSVFGFYKLIKELKNEGKTIIICAHDGIEGIDFTKKYELKNGQVQQII